jgi:hypothetical protein
MRRAWVAFHGWLTEPQQIPPWSIAVTVALILAAATIVILL